MGSSKSSRTSVISAPTAYMPAATKQHSRPSTADSIFSETGYGHSLLDQHVTRAVRLAATPAPNYRPKSRATIIRAPAPGLGWAGLGLTAGCSPRGCVLLAPVGLAGHGEHRAGCCCVCLGRDACTVCRVCMFRVCMCQKTVRSAPPSPPQAASRLVEQTLATDNVHLGNLKRQQARPALPRVPLSTLLYG